MPTLYQVTLLIGRGEMTVDEAVEILRDVTIEPRPPMTWDERWLGADAVYPDNDPIHTHWLVFHQIITEEERLRLVRAMKRRSTD